MFHFEWLLGCDLSVDDQKVGFQGRQVDIMRISYKNKGDNFQADALFDREYTQVFLEE